MLNIYFVEPHQAVSTKPHLRVGFTDRSFPHIVTSIQVEAKSLPIMTIDVFGNPDHYFFRKEALEWKQYIIVGVGHQVTFVNLNNYTSTTIDLDCYFGYLYPVDNFLLVASARSLHCFSDAGDLQWISHELGVDGVIVERVSNGVVYGTGECDPPDGWQPFQLNLATGK